MREREENKTSGAQIREEATDRPGHYRYTLNNRTIAYMDDFNGILTIYRRRHQLYEQGEIVAINTELLEVEFKIIKIVLIGEKHQRKVINIPRDIFEAHCFEFPINSAGRTEILAGLRFRKFMKPSRDFNRSSMSKK